ncbi:MAG TPA: FAD-dependent oxidoreductase [Acidimicrobiales bacterium]|nr:FAD-dependent oxidoreductase [Acidimicrobiales bacterium]
MQSVLVLGAGFAGLELATRLSEELPDAVDVTLIDRSDAFVFGYSKLDVMFGRRHPDDVRLPYSLLAQPSVHFVRETVISIDPQHRRVTTDGSVYEPDILVVALGADLDPAATPGLVEEGTEYYSVQGANRVSALLPSFEGGDAVIGVLGPFFKCPAAPFETALMLHDYLDRRGRRSGSTITVISPMPTPIPISPEASAGILDALGERDIGWWPESKVTQLDSTSKTATLADGRTAPYDLFLGVPVHRAPRAVEESTLSEDGWIPVDHATFATRFENVYAIGDVTSAPVPRVGVIAEGEAQTLAEVLIHRIRGGAAPEPYRGLATCYIEFGGDRVARFDANFLSGPSPFGTFTEASDALAASKAEFGSSRRRRWFGLDA